jgi:hypothetical protein
MTKYTMKIRLLQVWHHDSHRKVWKTDVMMAMRKVQIGRNHETNRHTRIEFGAVVEIEGIGELEVPKIKGLAG